MDSVDSLPAEAPAAAAPQSQSSNAVAEQPVQAEVVAPAPPDESMTGDAPADAAPADPTLYRVVNNSEAPAAGAAAVTRAPNVEEEDAYAYLRQVS